MYVRGLIFGQFLQFYISTSLEALEHCKIRAVNLADNNKVKWDYLKQECTLNNSTYFKCWTTNKIYKYNSDTRSVSNVCGKDKSYYQACGFSTSSKTGNPLCGSVICDKRGKGYEVVKYEVGCSGKKGGKSRVTPDRKKGNSDNETFERGITFTCKNDTTIFLNMSQLDFCKNYEAGGCTEDFIEKSCQIKKLPCRNDLDKCNRSPCHKHLSCIVEEENCRLNTPSAQPKDCGTYAEMRCLRRVRMAGDTVERLIPKKWIMDGTRDCVGGEDEKADLWKKCRAYAVKGITDINNRNIHTYIPKEDEDNSTSCPDVFVCRDKTAVILNGVCNDNFLGPKCPEEDRFCESMKSDARWTRLVERHDRKHASYCLKGLADKNRDFFQCREINFLPTQAYGVSSQKIELPYLKNDKMDCRAMRGEVYVYMACNGFCAEGTGNCPLNQRHINTIVSKGSQWAKTLSRSGDKLVLVRNRGNEVWRSNVFQCFNNKTVLEYDKICDLQKDCAKYDDSDESFCSNHFMCSEESGNLIAREKMCDSVYDCADRTDECNRECPVSTQRIISAVGVRVIAWLIGSFSTLTNISAIVLNICSILSKPSRTLLTNLVITTMVALGDLLVGCYMISIAAIDHHEEEGYCQKKFEWLASGYCELLGIINSVGTQLSLFAMTALSIYRLYAVKYIKIQKSVDRNYRIYLTVMVLLTIFLATIISVVPILDYLNDYFTNAYYYGTGVHFLKGAVTKEMHVRLISNYFGRICKLPGSQTPRSGVDYRSWRRLVKELNATFTGMKARKIGFYGNHGVCMFKYFVTFNDDQWCFSLGILGLNFLCFIIITICYSFIKKIARDSQSNTGTNRAGRKRTATLNRKISLIIFTDFLCWIPFIISCCCHFTESADMTSSYEVFSLVVLPINSFINPIIYNYDTIIRRTKKKVNSQITKWKSAIEMNEEDNSRAYIQNMNKTITNIKTQVTKIMEHTPKVTRKNNDRVITNKNIVYRKEGTVCSKKSSREEEPDILELIPTVTLND